MLYEMDGPFAEDSPVIEEFADSIEHDWFAIGSEAGLTQERPHLGMGLVREATPRRPKVPVLRHGGRMGRGIS